jgi:hypothetical protein
MRYLVFMALSGFFQKDMRRIFIAVFMIFLTVNCGLALPPAWNSRQSRHFIVYYRSANKDLVEQLVIRSESYYRSIPKNFGLKLTQEWEGPKRSKVYIYDTAEQYQAQAGQPEWSDGSSIQKLRVIFSFVGAKNFFDSALPHELAHIIFREAVGFENKSVPVWLEEGIASYPEKYNSRRIEGSLRETLAKGLLPGLEHLQGINPRSLKDKNQIDIFYGQALSVVDYLISKFGSKRFGFFCRALGKGENLENSLLKAFYFKNIQELDSAWQEYLKEKGR